MSNIANIIRPIYSDIRRTFLTLYMVMPLLFALQELSTCPAGQFLLKLFVLLLLSFFTHPHSSPAAIPPYVLSILSYAVLYWREKNP